MRTSGFTLEQRQFALLAVLAGWRIGAVCRAYGIARVTFYRWKAELELELPAISQALLAALRAGPLTEERLMAALQAIGVQPGGTRKAPRVSRAACDDGVVVRRLVELAAKYKRWGYRRLHAELLADGLDVGLARVYRYYQTEGLATRRQRAPFHSRGRVGKKIVPTRPGEVWHLASAQGELTNGRSFWVLQVSDAVTGRPLLTEVLPRQMRFRAQSFLKDLAAKLGAPGQLHVASEGNLHREVIGWAWNHGVPIHLAPDYAHTFAERIQRLRCQTLKEVPRALEV